jgi:non-specific serine/threonine protein kinase/serine/threonine-protein kinase
MSADRWQRLNEIFHAAVAVRPGGRAAYLDEACAGDDALRREAAELLDAHLRAESDANAFAHLGIRLDEPASPSVEGHRIGPYLVSGEIGRGGMGAVWLAERADGQFRQRVAIKLIKRGMDTAQILGRFRVERQILASLDHPHIARLLDGGTTDDGLPYFVMEHIEGQPIDRYADERRLSVRDRLALFLQVCDAVTYAHQHLIVHRDIKPQNILVTSAGVPKLLDFGIAKVLQDAGDQGTLTMSGQQLLTPDYASPEQVAGLPTTTQTDVYSLGVVLYELLTGRSPYTPRTWSTPDVFESVRSGDVERPSTAIVRPATGEGTRRHAAAGADRPAATGAGSLERLRGQLRGDLDAIVLSALRKEPGRRYGSVEAMATDIRRHLAGLPVRARADGVWYRGLKFARRNRVAVAAALLVALTLVAGAIATAWQARNARIQARLAQEAQARAERRFAEVRRLANAVLFDYHDAIQNLPGATPVRARLVRDALQYLNGLAAEGSGDASLQRELALAYRKVAEVQGGHGASLGDTSGAIESHRKSLAILERLVAARPDDPQARSDVADGALLLANLVAVTQGQAEGLSHARRAVDMYEGLVSERTPALDRRLALASAYDVLGTILLESGKPGDALEIHRRQRLLLESAPASDQVEPRLRRALSIAYQHAADAQGTFGDLQGALDSVRSSLRIRATLSEEFRQNTDYRALLGASHYWEGDTLARLNRPLEALEAFRRSLAIGEELAAADPSGHRVTFSVLRVGIMLARLGDHEQALRYFRRAEAIAAEDVKADPENLWERGALIEIRASTCAALVRLARPSAASTCAETARLIEETIVEPTNAVVRAAIARSYTAMADANTEAAADRRSPVTRQLACRRTARDFYRKSVAIWSDMAARGMLTSSDDEEAAAVSRSLQDTEAALRQLGAD